MGDAENMDLYYHYQYQQNERLEGLARLGWLTEFKGTVHRYLLTGSMTGTVYLNDQPIQTFIHSSDDGMQFKEHSPSQVKVVSGRLLLETGELTLCWNEKPEGYKVIVSYEWEYGRECQG